jgi:hypothetical protein
MQYEIGDGEDCDLLVCRLITKPLLFPDNLLGHCTKCHRLVQFRPSAPRLTRVCLECFRLTDRDRAVITPQTLFEIRALKIRGRPS